MRLSALFVEYLIGCAAFGHCLDNLDNFPPRCAVPNRAECSQQSKYLCGVASELLLRQKRLLLTTTAESDFGIEKDRPKGGPFRP